MSRLSDTYEFAKGLEIGVLVSGVRRVLDCGLIAVGSGGSFSAAVFLQRIHQATTGIPTTALTPLQLEGLSSVDPATAIWLLSARGRNADILRAAKTASALEPEVTLSLTAAKDTELSSALRRDPFGIACEFTSPAGNDGFLATNSLLATCILLWRAYHLALGNSDLMPSFENLIGVDAVHDEVTRLDHDLAALWSCETILLLHAWDTTVAAIDIESKAMEAAMCFLTVSDLRSFGHGRHHWLSRFGNRSAVLVLASPQSSTLAKKTVQTLPRSIESRIIHTRTAGLLGELEALVRGFLIIASLGHARKLDPGRPGIAPFGSRVYHLKHNGARSKDVIAAATSRKVRAGASAQRQELEVEAHRALERFSDTRFGAVLLDLDGTLVGAKPEERYAHEARTDVRKELARLIEGGIRIAIATGRGPSSTTLRLLRSLIPKTFWNAVLVAYHNGAEVSRLDETAARTISALNPNDKEKLLTYLGSRLKSLGPDILIKENHCQITMRSRNSDVIVRPHHLFVLAQEAIAAVNARTKAVRSSHSVDIIHVETSKASINAMLSGEIDGSAILRIGDSGAWPGNDFELLSHEHGLSVDRVSMDSSLCWNLLPRGTRGVDGTLRYLKRLKPLGAGVFGFGNRLA